MVWLDLQEVTISKHVRFGWGENGQLKSAHSSSTLAFFSLHTSKKKNGVFYRLFMTPFRAAQKRFSRAYYLSLISKQNDVYGVNILPCMISIETRRPAS